MELEDKLLRTVHCR